MKRWQRKAYALIKIINQHGDDSTATNARDEFHKLIAKHPDADSFEAVHIFLQDEESKSDLAKIEKLKGADNANQPAT